VRRDLPLEVQPEGHAEVLVDLPLELNLVDDAAGIRPRDHARRGVDRGPTDHRSEVLIRRSRTSAVRLEVSIGSAHLRDGRLTDGRSEQHAKAHLVGIDVQLTLGALEDHAPAVNSLSLEPGTHADRLKRLTLSAGDVLKRLN